MPTSTNPIFYHGGKVRVAKDILAMLVPASLFVDVCGGGGAITAAAVLSRKYHTVVYNEIETQVTNLLLQIRDNCDALKRLAEKTPVSRGYFTRICQNPRSEDPLLAAVETLYLLYFGGHGVVGAQATADTYRRPLIRHENSIPHSPAAWQIRLDGLDEFARVFRRVAIENRDAADVVKIYGAVKPYWKARGKTELVLLFFDPPYGKTQHYQHSVDKRVIAGCLAKKNPLVATLGAPEDAAIYGREPDRRIEQENNNKQVYTTGIWANFPLVATPTRGKLFG